MTLDIKNLKPEEQAIYTLRSLYEKYGYKKYKISHFEEYSLYLKYKNFLKSQKILNFTNLDGKLLALKPDVTLSIIKNIKDEKFKVEKLFYTETVYRENLQSNTFKEINQMGLEYIGDIDNYAVAEVIYLAKKSLENISDNYILELGHMGFISAFLESLQISTEDVYEILQYIKAKSSHELLQKAEMLGLSEKQKEKLSLITTMTGNFNTVIALAKSICVNDKMMNAISSLQDIYNTINTENCKINLDLTLVNDNEFYDDILFSGYLKGLSLPVLSGGRYDGLMRKLGKKSNAIGFAIYLNELEQLPYKKQEYDVDIAIIASENCENKDLLKQVNNFTNKGYSVRVLNENNCNIKYKELYKFTQGGLEKC